MGVFANGLEISGKAVQAQTIAAFPDVCFTPPQTPATPPGVPIPYPSFGMASDTQKGTSTVKIGGKTVNIKNKSNLSKTTGTEAGAAPKKGIITSKNTGKEQFNSWSNDVKFDGEPVIRMSDLATNNHASPAGNTPPWPHMAGMNIKGAVHADVNCIVGEYDTIKEQCRAGKGETHHVVPDMVYRVSKRRGPRTAIGSVGGTPPPTLGQGMAICLKKTDHSGLHSDLNKKLHDLDAGSATPGTAPVKFCVREAMKSLLSIPETRKSKGKPMSAEEEECIKIACRAARAQSASHSDRPGRTNPYRPPDADSSTYQVLTQSV